jgi:hypothetical protein
LDVLDVTNVRLLVLEMQGGIAGAVDNWARIYDSGRRIYSPLSSSFTIVQVSVSTVQKFAPSQARSNGAKTGL